MSFNADSPAPYPKHNSYKKVFGYLMETRKEETRKVYRPPKIMSSGSETSTKASRSRALSSVPSKASSMLSRVSTANSTVLPEPGDHCMRYKLKDGGKLTIIHKKGGEGLIYWLQCVDGRKVVLEKSPTCLCLIISDKDGNPVQSLACTA